MPGTGAPDIKALVYQGFGSPDILRCEEIPKPIPGDDEVLIKVRAASLKSARLENDERWSTLVRLPLGLGKPKLKQPAVEVAGQAEAVGRNVTHFTPGDEVFGICRGAFAEYTISHSVPGLKSALAHKPANVTFE